MSTELSGQRYIFVPRSTPRSQLEQPEFLVAAVKDANETYEVVTKREENQFGDFYDQQLKAGVDVAIVEKMITDHIGHMRDMYVQAKQLLVYAAEAGIEVDLNIDMNKLADEDDDEDEENCDELLVVIEGPVSAALQHQK